jgi:hypothetical protein
MLARFAIIVPMRSAALAFLLALSLVACKKKPDPAELARTAAPAATAPPAGAPVDAGSSLLSGFEGRVKLAVKGRLGAGQDKPTALDLTILVKDGKLRADVPPGIAPLQNAGPVYVIVEAEAKKVYAVMESKKQALLIDLETLAPQLEAMAKRLPTGQAGAGGTGTAPMPTGTMTGKTDKVAGYTCEIWEVKHEGKKTELCVMKDEKAWLKFPQAALPPQLSWAKELADGRHLPLRYVAYGPDAKETGRVEVTSVEKTALSASDFEVPKGFVIANFDQMMAGLGGLMGGGAGGLPGMKGLPPGFKLPPGLALPSGLPARQQPNAAGSGKP